MRLFSWIIVFLALLNVAFLASLPLFSASASRHLEFSRPDAIPEPKQLPEKREEPLVPVEELHEELRLPRVDTSLTDEHSQAALAAYEDGDYERAFKESILSLDPAPLEKNELVQALGTEDAVQKPNGREANRAVEEALQPILRDKSPHEVAVRLNNAAAMWILAFYNGDPYRFPSNPEKARVLAQKARTLADRIASGTEELAYQAADLDPSYCPAFLNLTLFNGMQYHAPPTYPGLERASVSSGGNWTDFYAAEGCDDPALLYHLAQVSIVLGDTKTTLQLINSLQDKPRWAGLAHSLRGDVYYWEGLYSLGRANEPRPFTAQRYFNLALEEYTAALALQPDDPAIRHGKALTYLELGEVDKAIREAETALKANPASIRLQQTLVSAHQAKGDYATAARLERDFLSTQRPAPEQPALVPYSAISHGTDRYSQLRVQVGESGSAGAAFFDDEVIQPFEPSFYYSDTANWYAPFGLSQYREEYQYYSLLRNDLLSGEHTAFSEDLEHTPGEVRRNKSTLLLIGMEKLLRNPEALPTGEAQLAIDDYLASQGDPYYAGSGEPEPQGNDPFYKEAGNFFREYEQYNNALRIYRVWQNELESDDASSWRRAKVRNLIGEALFLKGSSAEADGNLAEARNNYGEALAAFDQAVQLRPDWPPYAVRQAFMHEKLENYAEAEELYRGSLDTMKQPAEWIEGYEEQADFYDPDNYQAAKHLGDVLLKQADESADNRNHKAAQAGYDEAIEAYRLALEQFGGSTPNAAAVNNLGIALLEKRHYDRSIKILKTLVKPSTAEVTQKECVLFWEAAGDPVPEGCKEFPTLPGTPDENNPVFHLNLGWAYELNEQPEGAKEHYLAAVKSNPSFHPAMNDLGVMAVKNDRDLEEAKSYFNAALKSKEDYAHASHNLGVALLNSDPHNFLAAQEYLARATEEDPSLSEASYDYISDNGLYFLNLSLTGSVPPGWKFAKDAETSTGMVSGLVLLLLLGRIAFGYARTRFRGAIIKKILSSARRLSYNILLLLPFLKWGIDVLKWCMKKLDVPSSRDWWITPVALLVSAPAVVVVIGWDLLRVDSEAKWVMLGVLLYLVVVTLLVHHAGHALAALWFRMRFQEALWPMGIVQAAALVVIGGPAVAPVPASVSERADAEGKERERSLIYLAGPVASILFAVGLFFLFLISYIPLLRLGAILSLAVAVVSLLLLPPLDGGMVSKGRYTRWVLVVGAVLAFLWTLVYFSNQLYCIQSPGDYCWGVWF